MTDTTTNTAPTIDAGPAADDPRPTWAKAVRTAKSTVAHVTPDDLGRPTPCDEFDVEHLLGHLTSAMIRTERVAAGADPFGFPDVITGVAPDAWPATLTAQLDAATDAWADDAALDRVTTLPWVEAPGRVMLPTYVAELTVHTWDLAQALGVDADWDDDVVAMAWTAAAQLLPPGRREEMTLPNGMAIPFHSAIDVDGDAAPIDRLIAWYGRQP